MDGVDGDEAVGGFPADLGDDLGQPDDRSRSVRSGGHGQKAGPGVDERKQMGDVERPFGSEARPPDLASAALAPDRFPGRDVGHVVEVGDDQVG